MSVSMIADCPFPHCPIQIPVTIDLVLDDPDVLPQRQVHDDQPVGPAPVTVRAELSTQALARINNHLVAVHHRL